MSYSKPLPTVTLDGAPFWEATREKTLKIQHCPDCGQYQFPPRRLCMHCAGRKVGWRTVCGQGRIYSFTIVHRAPEASFAAEVPYVVAVIDLAEGGRMMTNLVGCSPADVRVDMPVTAVFEEVTDTVTLVKFRPTNDS